MEDSDEKYQKYECLVKNVQRNFSHEIVTLCLKMEYVVAQLVKALHYKLEGHGFDFRWVI
jgi:ACT domain-containing protein